MISLSLGLDVAIKIVKVANVSLEILKRLFICRALFIFKKYKNMTAAILLIPN